MLHHHQPVGNFGWVIEEVWQKAYRPMLAALERHPTVKVGLHYSGPLIEWLRAHHPETLVQVRRLVDRGQAEWLGGAWYEPILVALPVADRHGQLVRMAREIEALSGVRPRGAWLAERVWEPTVASDLADGGYAYAIVDDNHLREAAIPDERMWGSYVVDDQGRMLTVFASEKGLRYTIPWRPVSEVIDHLRAHATADGRNLGMMGDDGEKFGAWPGTDDYCWGSDGTETGGWVEAFLTELETNASWLATVRPSDWLATEPPLGRVALPTSSYLEMTEWALPPDDARSFTAVLERARAANDPSLPFLHGGTWRAFQSRYREVNDLHKQMLRVSRKVAELPPGALQEQASDHLYRGQSNDAYWHGLFGGIYLPDLRMAAAAELIGAEDLADGGAIAGGVADYDLDGLDEVLLGGPGQSVMVDLAEGGGISAWDLLATRVAAAFVLRRRPEAYHATLLARAHAARAAAEGGPPISPHESVVVKEAGLERFLVYDRHELRGALIHLIDAGGSAALGPDELAAEVFGDLGDFVDQPFSVVARSDASLTVRRDGSVAVGGADRALLAISKRFALGGTRLEPTLECSLEASNPGTDALAFVFDLEWPFQMLGGGGNPQAWYEVAAPDGGAPVRSAHDGSGDVPNGAALAFGNDYLGVRIDARFEPAARLTWHPIETVSQSEAGFERIYQGSALHIRWPMSVEAGGERRVTVRLAVTQSRDLATGESA